jgi:hypothetical protein
VFGLPSNAFVAGAFSDFVSSLETLSTRHELVGTASKPVQMVGGFARFAYSHPSFNKMDFEAEEICTASRIAINEDPKG